MVLIIIDTVTLIIQHSKCCQVLMEKPAVFGPKQGSSLVCIQCCRTLQSIKVKKNTASADKNATNKGKKYNQC
jgi:hypothetical protein